MSELKPCPWCGVEPAVWSGTEGYGLPAGVYIGHTLESQRCPFSRPAWFTTRERAIAAWNDRPSPWVRVEERLPGDREPFLLFCGEDLEDSPHFGSYADGDWYCEMRQCGGEAVAEKIVWWQPVYGPALPADEEEKYSDALKRLWPGSPPAEGE